MPSILSGNRQQEIGRTLLKSANRLAWKAAPLTVRDVGII
jgi:hypothetical protein